MANRQLVRASGKKGPKTPIFLSCRVGGQESEQVLFDVH